MNTKIAISPITKMAYFRYATCAPRVFSFTPALNFNRDENGFLPFRGEAGEEGEGGVRGERGEEGEAGENSNWKDFAFDAELPSEKYMFSTVLVFRKETGEM